MTKFIAEVISPLTSSLPEYTFKESVHELADGGWIVTWMVEGRDRNDKNILTVNMQRYDASGDAMGGIRKFEEQGLTAVTTLADGGWLMQVWAEDDGTGPRTDSVWRFDATGALIQSVVAEGTYFVGLTGLPDGGWISLDVQRDDVNGWNLVQQRYSADGEPLGSSALLPNAGSFSVDVSDITVLKDGGWITNWTVDSKRYQQRFAEDGTAADEPVMVREVRLESTALEDGGWLILNNRRVQRYDAQGQAVGDSIIYGTPGAKAEAVEIEGLSDGGWVVAFRVKGGDIHLQVFDADGNKSGRPYVTEAHSNVGIEALDNGAFVLMWGREARRNDFLDQVIYRPDENSARPVAKDDKATILEGEEVVVDVLANDRPADPHDILTLETAKVAKGDATVEITENGKLEVVVGHEELNNTQTAKVSIKYTMTDGFETVTGHLTVTVQGVTGRGETIYGTEKADRYDGAPVAEIYYGLGGDDVIRGGDGNDFLYGGDGDDVIHGGRGKDRLFGGAGDDRLYGDDDGDDEILIGGRGDDLMVGGLGGQDTFVISRGDGRDHIKTGFEDDIVDLRDFRFKSYDQLEKLIERKGDDIIVDLPGNGRLFIEDAWGVGFMTVMFTL